MVTPPIEAPRAASWPGRSALLSVLARYAVALLAVGGAAFVKYLLAPILNTPTGLFYLAVATAAWYGGLYPGIFATIASLVVSDVLFDYDFLNVSTLDRETAVRTALFVLVSTVISVFCEALHRSRREAVRAVSERVAMELASAADLQRAAEERERLLAATREALTDAEEAARLKDEFLATVSHELRNPLNAIVGWAHVLQGRGAELDPEARLRALDSIVRSAKTQARLVDDLLDVARVVSGKLRLNVEVVDLRRVVEGALLALAPQAEKKGVRVLSVLETDAPVLGDAARLQQVVFNLLDNAVKFTPAGGQVQVAIRRRDSQLELAVTDDGQGIDPEFLSHVFDLFRQGDAGSRRRHGGLGLGLAIARQLVEQHGGALTAESEGIGLGARFVLSLPVAPLGAPSAESTPDEQPCAVPGVDLTGVSVLVLEDDPDTRELLESILEGCGAKPVLAANVEEALRLLSSERPQVVVSDIEMAGENGYDFIRRVRELPPEQGGTVPAAALTAYARGEDRRRVLNAGFQLHAAKPIEPEDLVAIVANLAARTHA